MQQQITDPTSLPAIQKKRCTSKIHRNDQFCYILSQRRRIKQYKDKITNIFNNNKRISYIPLYHNNNTIEYKDNKKKHIKIYYSDHGGKTKQFQLNIKTSLFNVFLNKDIKSFYISGAACHGAYYDEKCNNLFNIIKKIIKTQTNNKNTIGFISLVKPQYNISLIRDVIDKDNKKCFKRTPLQDNKQIDYNDVYKNKDDYFLYYCILNEMNENTGKIEQNIYRIPEALCYWREDLINKGEFMNAFCALENKQPYYFTTEVMENGKKTTKIIKIDWQIRDKDRKPSITKCNIKPTNNSKKNQKKYQINTIANHKKHQPHLNPAQLISPSMNGNENNVFYSKKPNNLKTEQTNLLTIYNNDYRKPI